MEKMARSRIFSQFLKIKVVKFFSNQQMLLLKTVQKPNIWGGRRSSVFLFLASFGHYQQKTVCPQSIVVNLLNKK